MCEKPTSTATPTVRAVTRLDSREPSALVREVRARLLAAGETYRARFPLTVVEIQRASDTHCLLVNTQWIELAISLDGVRPDLVNDVAVPPGALAAILFGTFAGWQDPVWDETEQALRSDGVLLLRKLE